MAKEARERVILSLIPLLPARRSIGEGGRGVKGVFTFMIKNVSD